MAPGLPDPVEEKLEALPAAPGCYIFRDRSGTVLYVGKAKSLRARVRSYFQSGQSDSRPFLPWLRQKIHDLETLVTQTEKEAAILENSLIKSQKPKFNVKLRDDKEYLTLRLDPSHDWPRLELVRRPKADHASYFGPYHSATAARRTLHLVEKHFQLRTCSDRDLLSRRRPCLQYQIKRCLGPCVYPVDRGLYAQQVEEVGLFLRGKHQELTRVLRLKMKEASQNLDFELAAAYRDQLAAVESVQQKQRVVSVSDCDQDVLGMYREGDLVELSLLYVRSGRVVEAMTFSQARVEAPDDEIVAAYLREHYWEAPGLIPDEIILPVLPEGADGVAEWLWEERSKQQRTDAAHAEGSRSGSCKVALLAPSRGKRRQLLDLALENARHAFEEKRRSREAIDERLTKLRHKLRLKTLPRRIECVDISHLGGEETYGSVVALLDGVPDKKRYKMYRVRSAAAGDDYLAMYEVLTRRFTRGRNAEQALAAAAERAANAAAIAATGEAGASEDVLGARAVGAESFVDSGELDGPDSNAEAWELPDLFVVDGGRGQLAVALTAARDLGLHDLALAGLAKERENVAGDKLVDRIYLPGQKNPISLRSNSPELFLLGLARDEAHRFANRARKRAGKKRRLGSALDHVPGIGSKTRSTLLRCFGSLTRLKAASPEEWIERAKITRRQAESLRRYLADGAPPSGDVGS